MFARCRGATSAAKLERIRKRRSRMSTGKRLAKRSILGSRVCAPTEEGIYMPGLIQATKTDSRNENVYTIAFFHNKGMTGEYRGDQLVGAGFKSVVQGPLKAGQKVYVTLNGREVCGIVDQYYAHHEQVLMSVYSCGQLVQLVKRVDEVRLLESRKSARLLDVDVDYSRLAEAGKVGLGGHATNSPTTSSQNAVESAPAATTPPPAGSLQQPSAVSGSATTGGRNSRKRRTSMSDTSDSRSDTMDDCMAAMVLMRLSVSPKSPRFSGSDSVASSLSSCVASSATSSAASSSLCSSIEPHSLPTSGVSSLGSSTGSSSSSSSASASSTSSASSGFGALALFDLELARRADGRRTEYRCKLCGVQFVAFDTVLRHIRFAHLDNNPAKRHHDEEEYYTRVEVKLDALHDQAIKNYGEIDAMDDEGIDEIDQNNDYCCSTECADAHSLVELQISQQQSQQLEVEKSANEMQSRCRRRCAEAGDYCSKLAVEPSVVETTIVASGMEEFVASFEAVEHNDSNNDIAKDDDDDGFGAHNDCRQDEEDDIMTLSDESTDDALSRPPTPQGSPSSSATSLLQSGDSRLRASSEGTTTENKGLMSGHVNICQLGQPSRSPLAEPTDEPLEETKPMIQSEQACLASGSRALVASARQVAGSVASSVQQTSITSQPKSALPQNSIFMSSAPTLSHLDMVRPPHEDPELQLVSSHYQHQHQQPLQNHYQHHQQQPHLQQSQQHQQRNGKFLSSSSPINIPPHFRHHCHSQHHHSGHHSHHHQQQQLQHSTHNGGGCSQLAQLQQQQQHHHSHPQQQQQQKKLQTKIQHHNMSPKHRNRGRSESRKCRKVYGMENRDQWCTQCKWKKACTRFTD